MLISHPTASCLPQPSPPPPPPSPPTLFPSQQGVPAEDHCLRSEGPVIAGFGRSRRTRRDQSYRFHHLGPTAPDDNVGIPHAAQQAWSNLVHRSGCHGPAEAGQHGHMCTVHVTQIHINKRDISKTPLHVTLMNGVGPDIWENCAEESVVPTMAPSVRKRRMIFTAVIAAGGESCCASFSCSSSLAINHTIIVTTWKPPVWLLRAHSMKDHMLNLKTYLN